MWAQLTKPVLALNSNSNNFFIQLCMIMIISWLHCIYGKMRQKGLLILGDQGGGFSQVLANVLGFPPLGATNPSSPSSLCGPPSGPPHRGSEQLRGNRAIWLAETGEPRSHWLPLFTPLAVPLVAYYTELFSLRGRHKGLTEGFLSMAKGENELKILRLDAA